MKAPLTPLQKEQKALRNTLGNLCERVLMQWSLRRLSSWPDVYQYTGTPTIPRTDILTFPELKAYLKGLQDALEKSFQKELVTAIITANKQPEPITQVTTEVPLPTPTVASVSPQAVSDEDLSSTNDYGLVASPNEKAFLYWFQKKAIKEALDLLLVRKVQSFLLLSATGTGKTFMVGGLVRRLYDAKFHEDKTAGIVYYLYVTRASIVEQTKRVFENVFGLRPSDGVEVLNIEQLRSRAGKMWVNEKTRIVNGEEEVYWEWRKFIHPVVVIWDECQALKNSTSTQSKIAAALNNVDDVTQIHVSATPFTRVCEAKCFAVSTHKDIGHITGLTGHKLTNESWPTYASRISGSQSAADDYNEAAVERLIKDLESYIVRVKGVRPQFDAINMVEMIRFQTKEERLFYEDAYDRYLREKAKLDAAKEKGDAETGIQMLVAFLKFRMAAEFCRKNYLAKRMFDSVNKDGKAAVCALNFKGTIIEIVKLLVDNYGVDRSQISLIWGGGQTQLNAKQKAKQKVQAQADKLVAAGMSMDEVLETLDLDEVEDRIIQDLPEYLKLGTQTKEERQREIDRFQSGKSKYCLFTFRAGGVGLSLHHTDEQCSVKVRHQKNGYAVVEDVPNVPVRPRRLFAAPTYSAIEIVQGLGRCPRLTSLSDTEQFLVFYTDTIEDDVAAIVSKKLRCLSKVVKTREKWADVVMDGKQKTATHMQDIPDDVKGEDNMGSGEEEEE